LIITAINKENETLLLADKETEYLVKIILAVELGVGKIETKDVTFDCLLNKEVKLCYNPRPYRYTIPCGVYGFIVKIEEKKGI
jgi:hypothetical protein